jgi:tetratricopeptide (TPR) repeat protein
MSPGTGERLSTHTLALALGLSALGAGGIHLAVLAPYALLVSVSALILAFETGLDSGGKGFDRRAAVVTGVWFSLALFCLLQCIPLPLNTLARIAPDNADIWSRALRPFGLPAPSSASLSLAPGRSVIEAVKAASYGLVFAVAAQLSRRRGMRPVALLAFGLCVVVAAVTAGHELTSAERLYGAYKPLDAYSIAPVLNANSRAGYLNLGFFCGLGLLFRAGSAPSAAPLGLGLAFLAAEILLCESRAGTGTFLAGLLLLLLLPGRASPGQHPSAPPRRLQAALALLIGGGGAVLAWAARRSPLGLNDRSLYKFDLFGRVWHMTRDHLLFGVGRGAFAGVFAAYQGERQALIAEHAENLPLQWASEWGLPVSLAALAALGWALYPLCRRATWSSPTARGALVGVGVVLAQNFFDLGLELPALGSLLALVLGGLLGSTLEDRTPNRIARVRPLLVGGALLTCLCAGFAWQFGVIAPSRLRHQLYDELASSHGAPPPESFWASLERAVRTYPAEPYFPLLGASAALGAQKDPLPWITRALERRPQSALAYEQLGRILHARRATEQALGALRHSLELDPARTPAVLDLVQSWSLAPEELEELVPAGAAGAEVFAALAGRSRAPEFELRWLEKSLARNPDQPDVHYALARALLSDVQRGTAGVRCAGERDTCLDRAESEALRGSLPGNSRSVILEARLLVTRGDPKAAEARLATGCEQFAADVDCLDLLFDLTLQNQSQRQASTERTLLAAVCGDSERCGQTLISLGNKYSAAGQWNIALTHYERAAREAPTRDAWRALANAATHVGQAQLAAQARRHLELLDGAEVAHPAASSSTQRELGNLPAPAERAPPAPSVPSAD